MGRPSKKLEITQSISTLKLESKKVSAHKRPRIQLLLLIKSGTVTTKQGLALALGINHNTAQSWRKRYHEGGLDLLLSDKRGGKRPPVIDAITDAAILVKLSSPTDAPRSFKELQQWVDEHYIAGINYHTLNKHVKRKYSAKLKVARKSHINKDEQAVEAFKKNQRSGTTY